jgi:hypothetical protein
MDEKKDEARPPFASGLREKVVAPYKPAMVAPPTGSFDADFVDKSVLRKVPLYELIYSILGLLLGFACIVGGILLFLHGVTGSAGWTAKFIGAESKLSDAAPGAVLFVVGGLIVFVTRFRITAHRSKEGKGSKS